MRDHFERERSATTEHQARATARIRTADPFITSEVLYQLSYGGAGDMVAEGRWAACGGVRRSAKDR